MSQAAVQRPPARFDASVVTGAKPAPFPGFVELCHPTLRDEAPSGGGWVHEIKFDGYRTQAHLRGGRPSIYTRAGHDWTRRFQPIAQWLSSRCHKPRLAPLAQAPVKRGARYLVHAIVPRLYPVFRKGSSSRRFHPSGSR